MLKREQSLHLQTSCVVAVSTGRASPQHGTSEVRRLFLCWKDASDTVIIWIGVNSIKGHAERFGSGPDH